MCNVRDMNERDRRARIAKFKYGAIGRHDVVAEIDAQLASDRSCTRPYLIGKIADANDVFQIDAPVDRGGSFHKLEPVRAFVQGERSFHLHPTEIGDASVGPVRSRPIRAIPVSAQNDIFKLRGALRPCRPPGVRNL